MPPCSLWFAGGVGDGDVDVVFGCGDCHVGGDDDGDDGGGGDGTGVIVGNNGIGPCYTFQGIGPT